MPGGSSFSRAGRRASLGLVALLVASVLVALPSGPSGRTSASAAAPVGATDSSYPIVDAAGGGMTFGGPAYDGDTLEVPLNKPIVGGAADPNGGYWLVSFAAGHFSFRATRFLWPTAGILPLKS